MKQYSLLFLVIVFSSSLVIGAETVEPINPEDLYHMQPGETLDIGSEPMIISDLFTGSSTPGSVSSGLHGEIRNVKLTRNDDGTYTFDFSENSQVSSKDINGEPYGLPFSEIVGGKLQLNAKGEVIDAQNIVIGGEEGGSLEIDGLRIPLPSGATFTGKVGEELFEVSIPEGEAFKKPSNYLRSSKAYLDGEFAGEGVIGPESHVFQITGQEGKPFKINPETLLSEQFRDGIIVTEGEVFYNTEGHPERTRDAYSGEVDVSDFGEGDYYVTNGAVIEGMEISGGTDENPVYLDFDNNALQNLENGVRMELTNDFSDGSNFIQHELLSRYEGEQSITLSENPVNGWPPAFKNEIDVNNLIQGIGFPQPCVIAPITGFPVAGPGPCVEGIMPATSIDKISLRDSNLYYDMNDVSFNYDLQVNSPINGNPTSLTITGKNPVLSLQEGKSFSITAGTSEGQNSGGKVTIQHAQLSSRPPAVTFYGENSFDIGGVSGYTSFNELTNNNHMYYNQGSFQYNPNDPDKMSFFTRSERYDVYKASSLGYWNPVEDRIHENGVFRGTQAFEGYASDSEYLLKPSLERRADHQISTEFLNDPRVIFKAKANEYTPRIFTKGYIEPLIAPRIQWNAPNNPPNLGPGPGPQVIPLWVIEEEGELF